MSDIFVNLVAGLSPTDFTHRTATSAVAMRNKFVLFALALRADDEGKCTVTLGELVMTVDCGDPALVRKSLRAAEEKGLIVRVQHLHGPNTYQLQRSVLEEHQTARTMRSRDSLYHLVDFGLDPRPLNALLRSDFDTLPRLGAEIARYKHLPVEEQNGFDRFLDVRNLGVRGSEQTLDAYAAWEAQQTS